MTPQERSSEQQKIDEQVAVILEQIKTLNKRREQLHIAIWVVCLLTLAISIAIGA